MNWFNKWRLAKLEESLIYAESRVKACSGLLPKNSVAVNFVAQITAQPEIIRAKIARLKDSTQ